MVSECKARSDGAMCGEDSTGVEQPCLFEVCEPKLVDCLPPTAFAGNNMCNVGYTATHPVYGATPRCGKCDTN